MANIRVWMFVSLICNVATFAVAQDQDTPLGDSKIWVNGWRACPNQPTCPSPGQMVPAYSSDGDPKGTIDTSRTPMNGLHDLNADYAIVRVAQDGKDAGAWVHEDVLSIPYCDRKVTVVPGRNTMTAGTSMGSGAGCPP